MNEITHVPDGHLYDANNDKRVLQLRAAAKTQCRDYNATDPDAGIRRRALLNGLFRACGENPVIEPPFYCDYGSNIMIGDNFYANHNLIILDGAEVRIGNNVFIAPNVGIYTAGHPLDTERRNAGLEFAKPVSIGSNVWIGAGVSILPGVSIGENVVIGAGSVVNREIPAGMLAAGNPCRVLREIGDRDKDRELF